MFKIALISDPVAPLFATAVPPPGEAGSSSIGAAAAGNRQLAGLARELAAMGCHVDIFVRRSHALQPQAHYWQARLRVMHVPAGPASQLDPERLLPYMVQYAKFVAAFARRQRTGYHIVHAQGWLAGCVAQQLRRALGIAYVVSLDPLIAASGRGGHGGGREKCASAMRPARHGEAAAAQPETTPVRSLVPGVAMRGESGQAVQRAAIEAGIVADADRVIVGSRPVQRAVRRSMAVGHGGGPAAPEGQRIEVVPDGFDPALFWPVRRRARDRLGLRAGEFAVLYAGSVASAHGAAVALDAVAMLAARHGIHARLLFLDRSRNGGTVHDGRSQLEGLAAQRGVAGQLTFLDGPPATPLRYCYSAADVLLSMPDCADGSVAGAPSPDDLTVTLACDGTAMATAGSAAVLEAMACATPVLATAAGDRYSILVHGHTGYLLPSADAAALADRLAQLHFQPALARRLGMNAWVRAHRCHTWRSIALRLYEVYRRVFHEASMQPQRTDATRTLAPCTREPASLSAARCAIFAAATVGADSKDAQVQRAPVVAAGTVVAAGASAGAC